MIKKLLSNAEAADILGVKAETLTYWRCVKRYDLPYIKIGSRVRYRMQDLEDFIEQRAVRNES